MNPQRLLIVGGAIVSFLFILIFGGKIWQDVDADQIIVVQSPLSGKLTWHTTPGVKWQGFGSVTAYDKLQTYNFEVPIRFNDGGHGTLIGSLNYELPLDAENLTELHVKYGSQEAIQKQLVETVANKCVYMTGPLMSSKESYAEKRTNLISFVEDQIMRGVYRTTQRYERAKDPVTGAEKTVTVVDIVMKDGKPERQEEAVLEEYGIKVSNFAITRLPYDEAVEEQIKEQQALAMKVQTAVASSREAEQRYITVAKEGEANAAKAKWEQEVKKAQAVTEAEQKRAVAELDAKTAAAEKQANILRGEGEAARKRLVMQADGALDPKLKAYIDVNRVYADAIKGYGGSWVPSVVMGEGGRQNGAMDLVNLLTAKTARELGLDMSVAGKENTK